jgi:hypothetical protein
LILNPKHCLKIGKTVSAGLPIQSFNSAQWPWQPDSIFPWNFLKSAQCGPSRDRPPHPDRPSHRRPLAPPRRAPSPSDALLCSVVKETKRRSCHCLSPHQTAPDRLPSLFFLASKRTALKFHPPSASRSLYSSSWPIKGTSTSIIPPSIPSPLLSLLSHPPSKLYAQGCHRHLGSLPPAFLRRRADP